MLPALSIQCDIKGYGHVALPAVASQRQALQGQGVVLGVDCDLGSCSGDVEVEGARFGVFGVFAMVGRHFDAVQSDVILFGAIRIVDLQGFL